MKQFLTFASIVVTETTIVFGFCLLLKWQPWIGTLLHIIS